MSDSKIEWTDKTWNPVTGCTKVSRGCKHCYAERIYERFNGPGSFKNVICHDERLTAPLHWKKPCKVFVNSMSDLFHEDVPFEFIDKVYAVMLLAFQHDFQILTKRPQRMLEYYNREMTVPRIMTELDLLGDQFGEERNFIFEEMSINRAAKLGFSGEIAVPNIWVGVSIENQETADKRIPILLKIPAAIRWLSCEPLLGPIDFYKTSAEAFPQNIAHPWRNEPILTGINWLVVGGESGYGARAMHPGWARSLRDQCKAADVAFLFKQWGEWYPVDQDLVSRLKKTEEWLNIEGGSDYHGNDVYRVRRIGKRAAGRYLDEEIFNEYPK